MVCFQRPLLVDSKRKRRHCVFKINTNAFETSMSITKLLEAILMPRDMFCLRVKYKSGMYLNIFTSTFYRQRWTFCVMGWLFCSDLLLLWKIHTGSRIIVVARAARAREIELLTRLDEFTKYRSSSEVLFISCRRVRTQRKNNTDWDVQPREFT